MNAQDLRNHIAKSVGFGVETPRTADPNERNETGNAQQGETRQERIRHFSEGRDYWWQYTKINGYAFKPSEQGLKRLSRNLDVNIPHLRKRINDFLSA